MAFTFNNDKVRQWSLNALAFFITFLVACCGLKLYKDAHKDEHLLVRVQFAQVAIDGTLKEEQVFEVTKYYQLTQGEDWVILTDVKNDDGEYIPWVKYQNCKVKVEKLP